MSDARQEMLEPLCAVCGKWPKDCPAPHEHGYNIGWKAAIDAAVEKAKEGESPQCPEWHPACSITVAELRALKRPPNPTKNGGSDGE